MTSDNFSEPHTVSDVDEDLAALERAYQQVAAYQAPGSLFVEAVEAIDWQRKPAELFKEAIRMAVSLDMVKLARELANQGHERHPQDTYLMGAVRGLAPPKLVERNRAPVKGLDATMAWLQEHAGEYQGSWVAVQAGELKGVASSRESLLEQLGEIDSESNLLIARIPW